MKSYDLTYFLAHHLWLVDQEMHLNQSCYFVACKMNEKASKQMFPLDKYSLLGLMED